MSNSPLCLLISSDERLEGYVSVQEFIFSCAFHCATDACNVSSTAKHKHISCLFLKGLYVTVLKQQRPLVLHISVYNSMQNVGAVLLDLKISLNQVYQIHVLIQNLAHVKLMINNAVEYNSRI